LSFATLVYCDNDSVVYLSSNPVQHTRTKHIEIDIHFVCDLVAGGQVPVLLVPSRYQYADIFTKGFPSALFEEFCSSLSVRCPPTLTTGECTWNDPRALRDSLEAVMIQSDEFPMPEQLLTANEDKFPLLIQSDATAEELCAAGTSKYWGVLRILIISLRLIPLYEHNQDFHQIVDFVEASYIRYALTFNPTVHVSHIRQFWSAARIETTEEGTKILATVD
nr:NBS-containing resistance-like protein [Tanacetum cinerariifolium]